MIELVATAKAQILTSNINYELDAFTPTDDLLCDEQLLEFYFSLIAGERWALERKNKNIFWMFILIHIELTH